MFKKATYFFTLGTISFLLMACPNEKESGTRVLMQTTHGDLEILLYDATPQHRDNFVKLANEGFYDSLLFHRVINEFMIQGGDPDSKNAPSGANLGSGGPGYTIPAEFNKNFIHKKGALSAARQGDQVNPEKASSGSQFYIVQGKVYDSTELVNMSERINRQKFEVAVRTFLFRPENADKLAKAKELGQTNPNALTEYINSFEDSVSMSYNKVEYTPEQIKVYATVGGTPFLDRDYTVFGEVLIGLDVVDKIATVATGQADRPVEDVRILSVKVIK